MDLQKFKNKIDDNESANDILDEKIANLFEEFPEFKEKYSYLLKNDSFSSLRPWIYRALIDQKPCINCQNFYSCPKGKRRGYYYDIDLKNADLINRVCSKKEDVIKYLPYLQYGQNKYEEAFSIFFKMTKFNKEITNPKTEFLKAAKLLIQNIKEVDNYTSSHIFYLQTTNDNRKILSDFAIAFALKNLKTTVVIDPTWNLNYFRLDKNEEDVKDLLELQKKIENSKVIIIENFDCFNKYISIFDNILLPILKSATQDGKIVIMSGEEDLLSSVSLSSGNYAKPHQAIVRRIKTTKVISFDEPVLFSLKS